MIEILENTTKLYDQDKEYVLNYLDDRGAKSRDLIRIIKKYPFGLVKDTSFFANGEKYGMSHFLAKSDVTGYDIRKVNSMLKTEKTDNLIFALVIGDDALCYNVKTREVALQLIQTGNGERIRICESMSKFIKAIE